MGGGVRDGVMVQNYSRCVASNYPLMVRLLLTKSP